MAEVDPDLVEATKAAGYVVASFRQFLWWGLFGCAAFASLLLAFFAALLWLWRHV